MAQQLGRKRVQRRKGLEGYVPPIGDNQYDGRFVNVGRRILRNADAARRGGARFQWCTDGREVYAQALVANAVVATLGILPEIVWTQT